MRRYGWLFWRLVKAHDRAYTIPMISCALIACTIAVLVSEAPEPANARTTYIITTPDGEFPVFWDEGSVPSPGCVRVQIDEPWNPEVHYWMGKESLVSSRVRERPAAREERIKRECQEHGYVQVNGRFVPQAEAALAERARTMAGFEAPSPAAAPPPPPPIKVMVPSSETIPDLPPPSLWKRWAPHAGLVVVAGLLLLLVWRTLLT
jgi:hypothetical protein